MTDEQLKERLIIKRTLIASVLFLLLAGGLFYFRFTTDEEVKIYKSEKGQEGDLQIQIDTMTAENQTLQGQIEETGRQLVSFTEDKLKYINLASTLSVKHSVRISKLSVSDVWSEGQMSGMTTDIEVEGDLKAINNFISEYCGGTTNRINKISCRPIDRYPWLARSIDGERVLTWFDLEEEEELYKSEVEEEEEEEGEGVDESKRYDDSGEEVAPEGTELATESDYITLSDMFTKKTMRVYMNIDFLGRS